jgi:hypothetical protein
MKFEKVIKALGPVVVMAIAAGLAACDGARMTFNGDEGVPLSELDLSGDPPTEVASFGPDTVDIRTGGTLAIEVEGSDEAKERMRFVRDGDSLGILRASGDWNDDAIATVTITMPAPRKLTVGGSGTMTAAEQAGEGELNVLGSGKLMIGSVRASTLKVNIAGSGNLSAAGTADSLELSIAGSGSAGLAGLKTPKADVNIAGSGDAVFASDGEVKANVVGSGDVTVRGGARCTVNSVGSGSLTCEREPETAE